MTDSNNTGGGGGQPVGDSHSIELGFDLQEAVTQRLAQRNKKAVQLSDLMTSTKFTKQEICTMYRGFKQVKLLFHNMITIVVFKSMQHSRMFHEPNVCKTLSGLYRGKPDRLKKCKHI